VDFNLFKMTRRIGGRRQMTMRLVASLLHLQRGQLHFESPVIFSSLEKCSRQSCIAFHTNTLTPACQSACSPSFHLKFIYRTIYVKT